MQGQSLHQAFEYHVDQLRDELGQAVLDDELTLEDARDISAELVAVLEHVARSSHMPF